MEKLLVILFLIKLYALKNIFNVISGKYGQSSLSTARNMERNRIKIAKVKSDIKFLLTCKRNNLRPTFARPKFAVKLDHRIVNRITKSIIEAELMNKYRKLKHLKREAKENLVELQSSLGYVLLCALNKSINRRIAGKRQEWKRTHERKLTGLFADRHDQCHPKARPRNIVHNFSSYELTAEEYHILTYGLDHHISTKLDETEVKAEFEAFFYGLNKQLGHLSSLERDEFKTKIR